MEYPTPHGDKLHALLNNKKLPKGDLPRVRTAGTAIEEVIVLRKAKRISAEVRRHFSTVASRRANREIYERHLRNHPLNADAFQRLISHVGRLFEDGASEQAALERGWF